MKLSDGKVLNGIPNEPLFPEELLRISLILAGASAATLKMRTGRLFAITNGVRVYFTHKRHLFHHPLQVHRRFGVLGIRFEDGLEMSGRFF